MKHWERLSMSLNHEEPDRCPLQISFTLEFAARLRASVNITSGSHYNPHGGGNSYELERTLGEDMLLASVGWANSHYANDIFSPGSDTCTDSWGIPWRNSAYSIPTAAKGTSRGSGQPGAPRGKQLS